MEHVLSLTGQVPPGLPEVVLPISCSAVDEFDQGVVTWIVLGIFVAIGLVEMMDNIDGLFGLSACQFLLELGEIGAILVVLLQTGYHILQILPAHPLVLEGDIGVHVLLQPLRGKVECLSGEVDIGDAFTGQQAALGDKLADGLGVLSSVTLEVGQLALD